MLRFSLSLLLPAVATANSEPLRGDALRSRIAREQDVLSSLIAEPKKMLEEFKTFITDKYKCQENLGGSECHTLSLPGPDLLQSAKYLAFSYNVELAFERNQHGEGTVMHGITGLMDLTLAEFKQLLGYSQEMGDERRKSMKEAQLTLTGGVTTPSSIDWRKKGAVTPVKDQGQCGSCWAFSTVETMESAALAQGVVSKDHPFIGAPQELVSCDKKSDNGCNGGLPANAFKYLSSTPLESENDYPYKSGTTKVDGTCNLDKSEGRLLVTKATPIAIWSIGETQDMTDWVTSKGPVSVAVHANHAWQTYKGGVMGKQDCPDSEMPNHAVGIVALDADSEPKTWTIRNSWASNWGEDGFIRITYGENTCNVGWEGYGVAVEKAEAQAVFV